MTVICISPAKVSVGIQSGNCKSLNKLWFASVPTQRQTCKSLQVLRENFSLSVILSELGSICFPFQSDGGRLVAHICGAAGEANVGTCFGSPRWLSFPKSTTAPHLPTEGKWATRP